MPFSKIQVRAPQNTSILRDQHDRSCCFVDSVALTLTRCSSRSLTALSARDAYLNVSLRVDNLCILEQPSVVTIMDQSIDHLQDPDIASTGETGPYPTDVDVTTGPDGVLVFTLSHTKQVLDQVSLVQFTQDKHAASPSLEITVWCKDAEDVRAVKRQIDDNADLRSL